MMRTLVSVLVFVLLPTACVTAGKVGPQGYSHERMGFSIPYAQPQDKLFINKSWKLEANPQGQPYNPQSTTYRVDVKSISGHEDFIRVEDVDLVWKHRETNGVISVHSTPLADAVADKKLPIIAKDQVERLSGMYYASMSAGSLKFALGKNFVTNIIASQSGTRGSAETYEAIVDVANAEQLKLNPDHRLLRYKMVLIRPKAADGWKAMRSVQNKRAKEVQVEETYPALIIMTYAMDHAFYQDYVADFDGLVSRLKLRD